MNLNTTVYNKNVNIFWRDIHLYICKYNIHTHLNYRVAIDNKIKVSKIIFFSEKR